MEVAWKLVIKNYHLPNGDRIVKPVWINNVVAIQRGTEFPNRYIIMSEISTLEFQTLPTLLMIHLEQMTTPRAWQVQ